MATTHQLAEVLEDWPALIDTLDGVLAEMAPLKGFYYGGQTAVAEHERSRVFSVIRERIRREWTERKPPAEAQLDSLARAHQDYHDLLLEHRHGRAKLADLERRSTILEHQIGRLRALHYANTRLGAVGL